MDRTTTAKLIYWIYIAGLIFGFPVLAGLAWAYKEKEKRLSDIEQSHFESQFLAGGGAVVLLAGVWIFQKVTGGDVGISIVAPWLLVAFMTWQD